MDDFLILHLFQQGFLVLLSFTPGVFWFRYTVAKQIAGISKCLFIYVAIIIQWMLINPHLSALYSILKAVQISKIDLN